MLHKKPHGTVQPKSIFNSDLRQKITLPSKRDLSNPLTTSTCIMLIMQEKTIIRSEVKISY